MKTLFGVLLVLSAPVLMVFNLLMVATDQSGTLYFILAVIALISGIVLIVSGVKDKRKQKIAAQQGTPILPQKPNIALKLVAIIAIIIVAAGVLWLVSLLLIST